jgi:hypothetical protein
MRIAMRLDQDPALQQFFTTFPGRLRTVLLRAAIRKAAVPMLAQARSNLASHVRVTGRKTDPLGAGLAIRAGYRRRGAERAIVVTPRRARLGIAPTSKWYYPAHIELGTRDTPALPYMRPVIAQQGAASLEIVRRELQLGIDALAMGKLRGLHL